MELTYRTEGDYLVPNLSLPPEEPIALGRYARLHRHYLKQHRPILYLHLKTTCTLNQQLAEVEQAAEERMELLVRQMAAEQGVTEELKANDQMRWVGLMNNIWQAAEEMVWCEIVYA